MDTWKLCNNNINNEIKEIKSLNIQIIRYKIENVRSMKHLFIDVELKRLMFKQDIKRLKHLYEACLKEE